jgi:hypothetical protein
MNIIDRIDQYLNEGKYPVDVMFTSKGGKYTITYINPKTKGLPSWVKKGPVKSMQDLEADFEVYNAEGRTEKNGFITEGKMKSQNTEVMDYWMRHGDNMAQADYYENAGERKGEDPSQYYKAADKIVKEVQAKLGKEVADAMVAHSDAMANTWYGQNDKSGESKAKKIRKQHNLEGWDGAL